jgi:hypothetical protein
MKKRQQGDDENKKEDMVMTTLKRRATNDSVNTKNWYRKVTDLWAEFGNEIPFDRKNLLRGFGKDACGRQYTIIRQKDCLRL